MPTPTSVWAAAAGTADEELYKIAAASVANDPDAGSLANFPRGHGADANLCDRAEESVCS